MQRREVVEEKAAVIRAAQIIVQRQSGLLSDKECLTVLDALETWAPGMRYEATQKITHEGKPYQVKVLVEKSLANQAPDSPGMLAVYRPIAEAEEEGTKDNPIAYVYGIDVRNGLYYSYNSKLWLAKADMLPCTWPPGTAGLWQWELVSN